VKVASSVNTLNPYPANVENMASSYNASRWQMGFNSAFKGLMEAIGDYYVTSNKILDIWHCPLGVEFPQTVGEMGTSRLHAMFAIHVFVKHRYVLKVFACQ